MNSFIFIILPVSCNAAFYELNWPCHYRILETVFKQKASKDNIASYWHTRISATTSDFIL